MGSYKLGILARIEFLGKVIPGDSINYMEYLLKNLKKECVIIDWRDIDSELNVSRHAVRDGDAVRVVNERVSLNDLCDFLFMKQLGPIHDKKENFLKFLESLDKFKGVILNDVRTFKNNLSKQYLLELQGRGFPVIPTLKLDKSKSLEEVKKPDFSFNKNSWEYEDIVVKPLYFGEGGQSVRRLSSFNSEEFEKYKKDKGELIIQPFIPEILTDGEYSLVFLGKDFSHAAKKFTGEFLINLSKNPQCFEYKPSEEEIEIGKKILKGWKDKLGF